MENYQMAISVDLTQKSKLPISHLKTIPTIKLKKSTRDGSRKGKQLDWHQYFQ